MKQKILDGLKQKYSNLGLSNEILEGQAEMLSSFATDDNLATLIEGQEKALKAFQSASDKERGRLANLQKELEALKAKQEQPKQKEEKSIETHEQPKQKEEKSIETHEQPKDDLLAKISEMMDAKMKSYDEKLGAFKQQSIAEKRQAEFKDTLKGLDPDFVDLFNAKFEMNKSASDEDYQTFLSEHKTKVTNLIAKQESFIPSGGRNIVDPSKEPTQKEVESIIKDKKVV